MKTFTLSVASIASFATNALGSFLQNLSSAISNKFRSLILVFKQAIISKGYNHVQVMSLGGLPKGMCVARLLVNGTVIGKQKVVSN